MSVPPICVSIAESAAMLPDLSDFVPEIDTLIKQYSRRVGPFKTVSKNGQNWYTLDGITDQRFIPPTVAKNLVDQFSVTIDRYPGAIVIPELLKNAEVPEYMPNRLKPDPDDETQMIPKSWAEWPASSYSNDYVDDSGNWVIDGASGSAGNGINGEELSALLEDGYVVLPWDTFIQSRPPEEDPI